MAETSDSASASADSAYASASASSSSYFPTHLTRSPLSRVPVASVPRFRSLNKFYGDALGSPEFSKIHSGESRILIGVLNAPPAADGNDSIGLNSSPTRFFIVNPDQEGDGAPHAIEVLVPVTSNRRVVCAGSMQGLLLMVTHEQEERKDGRKEGERVPVQDINLFLWNPITGDHCRIPDHAGERFKPFTVGLVYSQNCGDRLSVVEISGSEEPQTLWIYDVSGETWRSSILLPPIPNSLRGLAYRSCFGMNSNAYMCPVGMDIDSETSYGLTTPGGLLLRSLSATETELFVNSSWPIEDLDEIQFHTLDVDGGQLFDTNQSDFDPERFDVDLQLPLFGDWRHDFTFYLREGDHRSFEAYPIGYSSSGDKVLLCWRDAVEINLHMFDDEPLMKLLNDPPTLTSPYPKEKLFWVDVTTAERHTLDILGLPPNFLANSQVFMFRESLRPVNSNSNRVSKDHSSWW